MLLPDDSHVTERPLALLFLRNILASVISDPGLAPKATGPSWPDIPCLKGTVGLRWVLPMA